MRVLVTGAAGFIGSHLAERLVALGHEVRGLDAFTDAYSVELKLLNARHVQACGADFLQGDLAENDLDLALNGVEFVFHLAAESGVTPGVPFDAYARNNITATSRLLDAALRSRTLRGFVYASTSSVYGEVATSDETTVPAPISPYGATKLAAEQLVLSHARDYGFPACSLRLFSVYGPRERPEKLCARLIGSVLEGREFPLFEGSEHHARGYTYVGDAVEGLVAAMNGFDRCRGEIINVGAECSVTTAEVIALIECLTGGSSRIVRRPKRSGDQLYTRADIGKARRTLDYRPSVTMIEGLERQVAWYRQHMLGKIELW